MKYNYNGIEIELRDKTCMLNNEEPGDMLPQTNLYIRVCNDCNADCNFCEYHGKFCDFDISRLDEALQDLQSRNIVGKIQITGGEPTLHPYRLITVVDIIRKYFPDRFIGINSNGFNLGVLIEIKDRIDNIAISRHHYDDDINREIFNSITIPDTNQLKGLIDKVGSDKIHFSCNLMKNYLGNLDEIKKYLEFCSSIGCNDIGFVTLMDVNKFAKSERVIFDNIGFENDPEFLKYKQFVKDKNACRCANYIYHCKNTNKLIDIYGRFVMCTENKDGLISFDGLNLRDGFNGSLISVGEGI